MKSIEFMEMIAKGEVLSGLTSPADRNELKKFLSQVRQLERELDGLKATLGVTKKTKKVGHSSVTYRDLLEHINKMSEDNLDKSVTMVDECNEVYGFECVFFSDCEGILEEEHLILMQNRRQSNEQ